EQLSRALGVTESTIYNWESNLHHPPVSQCQKAIQFIGYDPFPKPNTLAERMISFRRLNGLRVKDAAAIASVDPCSWSSWEREEHTITTACRCKIDQLIGGESDH